MADTTDTALALISLSEMATYLKVTGTTEDAVLSNLIDEVSAICNNYTGRYLLTKTHTEYYNGNGGYKLILRNYPIRSVTSLHIGDANRSFTAAYAVTVADDVLVQKEAGILELWNNQSEYYKARANIKVVYSAGYNLATTAPLVPYDLQLAVKKFVAYHYMNYDKKKHNVQSETIGANTVSFISKDIPDEVRATLNKYKSLYGANDFSFAD